MGVVGSWVVGVIRLGCMLLKLESICEHGDGIVSKAGKYEDIDANWKKALALLHHNSGLRP
jgi:hypothetical protein